MGFPEVLHRMRERAGLSQSELAKKAGVPVRSIQNWEQGHRRPRAPALLDLARALGVAVESLITEMGADQTTHEPSGEKPAPKKAGGRKKT
jgi:transcriptional regulator with XRE-family HTH domain